ncbi:hypothetical protein LZ318_31850 [Saccharopolyspora indica]|uniref:hypothetical protein n=1 Tax=Saccharopolyspora indica TaxID=1229659 RepID=UPI0022EA556A|nr:hypothetical protein [Saccharopolyspora indica]MDA3644168.1 hypothetical protein [Saccharopolyspora indica]
MPDLAAITTDLAEWFGSLPLGALPPVAGVSVYPSHVLSGTAEVLIQLGCTGDLLTVMADWAEHLTTTVSITKKSSFVQAEVAAETRAGRKVTLWTHFDQDDLVQLGVHGVVLGRNRPVEVTAARLRQIAARRAEQ